MGHDIFDLVIILTLVFFTIRGISQGFIAEAAGIVSLLVGFWVAKTYNGVLEPYLTFLSDPGWRSICACAILFIGAMIVVAVAARVLKKIISFSFASWADRLAGELLGLAKGVIIWGLLLIIILNLLFFFLLSLYLIYILSQHLISYILFHILVMPIIIF